MNKYEYFKEQRVIEDKSWEKKYGKVTVSYTTTEEWQRVKGRSISCGEEDIFRLKRRVGIKSTEKYELSTALKASIGVKSIAKFEAELTAKVGFELTTEEYIEEEEEKKICAPECQRKHIIIYQLLQRHIFDIKDERMFLFNDGNQTIEVKEYLDAFWTSCPTAPDPECNCEDAKKPDGVINLILENLGLTSAFVNTDDGMYLDALEMTIGQDAIGKLFTSKLDIPTKSVPDYLKYIAGISHEYISVKALSIFQAKEKHRHPVVTIEMVDVEEPSFRRRPINPWNRVYLPDIEVENDEDALEERVRRLLRKMSL